MQARLSRIERVVGVDTGASSSCWVYFGPDLPRVRRVPGDRAVYALGVKGDSPFRRLHAVPRRFPPEADRRPGSPTTKRAAVILARLAPFLDGKQRKLITEAAFVAVV